MALSVNMWAESHYLSGVKLFNKTANYSDVSLYLIVPLLAFLLSVPGTLGHVPLNLLVLPHLLFLLLVFCFRFMGPTLLFQPMLQKVKETFCWLQTQCEEKVLTIRKDKGGALQQWDELTLAFFCFLSSSSYSCCMQALWSATLFSSFSSSVLIRSLSSSCFRLFSSIFWKW